jgi:hypothetical protein
MGGNSQQVIKNPNTKYPIELTKKIITAIPDYTPKTTPPTAKSQNNSTIT